ncbi:MAG: hypothetical protein IID45_07465, partial [Planctomycetes bacterium]|nr:hypothetical protein [Planctomycetota bacterium]
CSGRILSIVEGESFGQHNRKDRVNPYVKAGLFKQSCAKASEQRYSGSDLFPAHNSVVIAARSL